MEFDLPPLRNPTLFGSLSTSPPTSIFDSFSPLINLNDEFLDALNPMKIDDDEENIEDWIKPLLFDQDFQENFLHFNDVDLKFDDEKEKSNHFSQIQQDKQFVDLFEQQLPTTTTVRFINQTNVEQTEIPTRLFLTGNEIQFHPINSTGQTTFTTKTNSTIPSVPIVPARVLKGKKLKRGGRVSSRGTSRNSSNGKRRLNSTAAEPKASVVIIAEDATRLDSKTTTLGLSSTNPNDAEIIKSTSTRSSTRRRVKSTPREVILFRNGTFVSKEPITKQQTSNNQQQQQQQITGTGLQAAAQIVACNVLRQATLNDALIEQFIKREPTNTDDDYPIYCYSTPSTSSCSMTTAIDDYENNCSTTLKILGCNTTAPLTSTNTTTTTTIELLTFAALQQKQQNQQQQQFCYIKQEPITTTTTTLLLPRLLTQ